MAEEQKATSGRILPVGKRPGASRLCFTAPQCRAGHMAAGGGAWGFVLSSELGEAPALAPAASWHHGRCLPCIWERLAGVHSHVVTLPQQEETGWEG